MTICSVWKPIWEVELAEFRLAVGDRGRERSLSELVPLFLGVDLV